MKVCPNCKVHNKNKSNFCANCGERIETIKKPKQKDNTTYYNAIVVEPQEKNPRHHKVVFSLLFVLVFILYNIIAITMNYIVFGSLEFYLPIVFWYVPCFIIFFFPYNSLYRYFRKKHNKPAKSLPKLITLLLRAIGALLVIGIHVKIGWVLAFTKVIE